MATHEVDRKILSRLARDARAEEPRLSRALFQILGLSKMLSRRLLRARKLRRLEPSDEKAMTLYHHILWMSREGLEVVENIIMPFAENDRFGVVLRVFAYKLRASFYHVFCLFHNKPSVSPLNPAGDPAQGEQVPTALLPLPGNRQTRYPSTSPKDDKGRGGHEINDRGRVQPEFRYSMFSDESNVSNPFGSVPAISPPSGLPGNHQAPNPAAFLLPSANFAPIALTSFDTASKVAAEVLSGSAPLRLSIALEYSAFYWDCLHDHQASRRLARRAIREVYEAQEGMDDTEFEDAAVLVGTLGRMMRRKSEEQTPKMAPESPVTTAVVDQAAAAFQIPRRPVGTPPNVKPSMIPRPRMKNS